MQDQISFEIRLTAHMLKYCADMGMLEGNLLASEDIDGKWREFAPDFCAEAVREFNGYPVYCLACAGFLGMAVAQMWDSNWEQNKGAEYSLFKDERGFDAMDEHILHNILGLEANSKEEETANKQMHSCATEMYHLMGKEGTEAGTQNAYKLFLDSMTTMFKIGAALQLHKLGYKLERISG